jgi:exodeoxyribonuclease VII small subunit
MPRTEKMTYTEAVKKIEEVINKIENGELDIDELTKHVKEVSALLKFCKAKLFDTENEIEKIIEDLNEEDDQ